MKRISIWSLFAALFFFVATTLGQKKISADTARGVEIEMHSHSELEVCQYKLNKAARLLEQYEELTRQLLSDSQAWANIALIGLAFCVGIVMITAAIELKLIKS